MDSARHKAGEPNTNPDPPRPPAPSAFPPLAFGPYAIECELGRGRASVVYRAVLEGARQPVALKVLYPTPDRPTLEHVAAEVRREAERLRLLDHPHIVGVLAEGVAEGHAYIVFPLIRGISLEEALRTGLLSREAGLVLVAKIARAVDYAHSRGLIHRDLHPANILVGPGGEPNILDFGLSWRMGDAPERGVRTIAGSAAYMSPEQARGEEVHLTPASDVYSLGAILYEVLTGQPPFADESAARLRQLAMDAAPRSPRQLDHAISPGCEEVVLRCLEKDPRRRYASALALADALDRVARGKPPTETALPVRLLRRLLGSLGR